MSGLLDKFTAAGSPLSGLNGLDGPKPDFDASVLHDTYSLNRIPALTTQPQPTQLGLSGDVPSNNYKDNAPEKRTF